MLNSTYTLSCPECGHVWESEEAFPKECPKCKYKLNEELKLTHKNCYDCEWRQYVAKFDCFTCYEEDCYDWSKWKEKVNG